MKLPRAEAVRIDARKVGNYLLSQTHPVGRYKARIFAAVGFDDTLTDAFIDEVRRIAAAGRSPRWKTRSSAGSTLFLAI